MGMDHTVWFILISEIRYRDALQTVVYSIGGLNKVVKDSYLTQCQQWSLWVCFSDTAFDGSLVVEPTSTRAEGDRDHVDIPNLLAINENGEMAAEKQDK